MLQCFGSKGQRSRSQHDQRPSGWRHVELDSVGQVLISRLKFYAGTALIRLSLDHTLGPSNEFNRKNWMQAKLGRSRVVLLFYACCESGKNIFVLVVGLCSVECFLVADLTALFLSAAMLCM